MTLKTMRRPSHRFAATALTVGVVGSAVTLCVPGGAASAPPKLLGPVLSHAENATTTLARDGGFSVPLPNGYDFWVFADTPRYEFRRNRWEIAGFIAGSTAGMARFTPGKTLRNRISEIRSGARLRRTNEPAQFMSTPVAYMPDGSGRRCRAKKGESNAFSVRWPTGAALMPDKANVLVTYAVVCVFNAYSFTAQGWGFALFDYRRQRFSHGPTDVVEAERSGTAIPPEAMWGSPIIVNRRVTFFAWSCCTGPSVYSATMDATVPALTRRASYVPEPVPGLPMTYNIHVAPRSKTHDMFSMYVLSGRRGEYLLYAASSPNGPWSQVGSGVLPRCDKRAFGCHSIALHPELSPAGRLVISYYLADFGPGVATKHPHPHDPLRHVVMASLPCSC
jgi:hypothetical protein